MKNNLNFKFTHLSLAFLIGASSFPNYVNASEDLEAADAHAKAKSIFSIIGQTLNCCAKVTDEVTKIKPDTNIPLQRIKVAIDTARPVIGTVEQFVARFKDIKENPSLFIISDIVKESLEKANIPLPDNLGNLIKISKSTLDKLERKNAPILELWGIDSSQLGDFNLSKKALTKLTTIVENHNIQTSEILKTIYKAK